MPHKPKVHKPRQAPRPENRPTAAKRGYNSKWQKASKGYLRNHPICVQCGEPATVVDHIEPHRQDWSKFWNSDNWQALCVRCHNRKSATEKVK